MYALSGGVARRDLAHHHEDTKATKKVRQENRGQENEARRSLLSARIEPVSGHRDDTGCKIPVVSGIHERRSHDRDDSDSVPD